MGDSVTAIARPVRAVEATVHFGGELSLLIGITGGPVSPCGRGDQGCQADGFGIDRREQPRGAERRRLGARRDEDLAAADPFAVNTGVVAPIRPEVSAEQEPGQHRVVGGGRTVAAQQPQVVSLRTDDIVEAPRSVAGWSMSGGRYSSAGGCRRSGGAAAAGSPDRRGVVRRSVGSGQAPIHQKGGGSSSLAMRSARRSCLRAMRAALCCLSRAMR